METADVGNGGLLCVADVLQERAGGRDGERQIVGTESFQVESAELVGQQTRCAGELEVPGRACADGCSIAGQIVGFIFGDAAARPA